MSLPANWFELSALSLGAMIEDGSLDPVSLIEAAFDRASAHDPRGKIFISASETRAYTEAIAAHDRARKGLRRSALDGVPVAWKDNIEALARPTTGGSKLLADHVASRDAVVLERGVRAGLITLGKTAMTEFAFSGLGYNPTMGSPDNPFDTKVPRAPGGSSCGSAVAVATGLAPLGVGTDTAGSVRTPAAWNGLVGLKTTAGSIPLEGILPLSRMRDTVGPLTRSVKDAAALWAILAGRTAPDLRGTDVARVSLLMPEGLEADTDAVVWEVFAHAVECLEKARAHVQEAELAELAEAHGFADEVGNPAAVEGWADWGDVIEADPDNVFWAVRTRMKAGAEMSALAFNAVNLGLEDIGARFVAAIAGFDAVVMPAVASVPPRLSEIETPDAYMAANLKSLRFTRLANLLGLTALTLPCGMTEPTGNTPPLPVGLMLMAAPHQEAKLLRIGAALERLLPPVPLPIS